jgi:hypothetical protein
LIIGENILLAFNKWFGNQASAASTATASTPAAAEEDEEEDQDDRTTTIVHRVAEIIQIYDTSNNNKSSSRIIRTKGDANPSSIPGIDYPIREQDYIGKVVYVIPSVGLITKAFRPPVNYIIISVTLTLLDRKLETYL